MSQIVLFPNEPFDLRRGDDVARRLILAQAGVFRVVLTGGEALLSTDDAARATVPSAAAVGGSAGTVGVAVPVPARGGGGIGGGGGGSRKVAISDIDWTLIDPDGHEFFSTANSGKQVAISPEVLARYRDPAGFSSRPWTLRLSLPESYVSATKVTCAGGLQPAAEASASAPPLLSGVSVTTSAGNQHSFDFIVDRVGDLTARVLSTPASDVTIRLLDPGNRVVAEGQNTLSHPIGLAELHAARDQPWHLSITAGAIPPPGLAHCVVSAEVLRTLRIPAAVLQPRLDALLGDPATGGAFTLAVDYDSEVGDDRYRNIVSIVINEDLYFTLDAFGFLDNLENARLAWERTIRPDAVRVPLDPGVRYPFTAFESDKQFINLRAGSIAVAVGTTPGIPRITLTVPLQDRPDGKPSEISEGTGRTVELEGGSITADLYFGASAAGVTVSVKVPPPDIRTNLEHLPDWLRDIKSEIQQTFHDKVQAVLDTGVVRSIFTTLLGGVFELRSAVCRGAAFELVLVAGREEPAHKVSALYSARGTVAPGTPPSFESPNLDKIDHIVVLLMENRSFDHVLGYLSLGARSDVDGLTPALINSFAEGVRPTPLTETRLPFDPEHSFDQVALQLGGDAVSHEQMRGFVLSFLTKYPFLAFSPDSPQRKAQDDPYWYAMRAKYTMNAVMRYHTSATLPLYAYLAREHMICDRWYASHPGPTFPNRFYYLSGQLNPDSSGEPQRDNSTDSLRLIRGRTIQDALTERGIAWKMYESPPDVCMLRMYARYAFDDSNIRPMDEFLAAARAGTLPQVSFLEPNYHFSKKASDDHPPSDMAYGQQFIASVYNALTASPAFDKTLFIITYDEHGGLYDHRVPELADRYVQAGKPNLDLGYGVRVPAFIICPWVPAGVTTRSVTPAVFDHTSILKTIINRFAPRDPAIMSDRMAFANDLFPLLTLDAPRRVPPLHVGIDIDVTHLVGIGGTLTSAAGGTITAQPVRHGPVVATGAPAQRPAPAPTPASPAVAARLARRAMIAEAREQNAPLARQRALFQGEVDWRQYMTRMALLLK